jgi:hypothetical protein
MASYPIIVLSQKAPLFASPPRGTVSTEKIDAKADFLTVGGPEGFSGLWGVRPGAQPRARPGKSKIRANSNGQQKAGTMPGQFPEVGAEAAN